MRIRAHWIWQHIINKCHANASTKQWNTRAKSRHLPKTWLCVRCKFGVNSNFLMISIANLPLIIRLYCSLLEKQNRIESRAKMNIISDGESRLPLFIGINWPYKVESAEREPWKSTSIHRPNNVSWATNCVSLSFAKQYRRVKNPTRRH